MSNLKVENGLIKVGNIFTETKFRESQATEEAKTALGVNGQSVTASLGIAQVEELLIIDMPELLDQVYTPVPGIPDDQAVQIQNIYTDNIRQDSLEIYHYKSDGSLISFTGTTGTQQNFNIPKYVILPGETISLRAMNGNMRARITLKLVSILNNEIT